MISKSMVVEDYSRLLATPYTDRPNVVGAQFCLEAQTNLLFFFFFLLLLLLYWTWNHRLSLTKPSVYCQSAIWHSKLTHLKPSLKEHLQIQWLLSKKSTIQTHLQLWKMKITMKLFYMIVSGIICPLTEISQAAALERPRSIMAFLFNASVNMIRQRIDNSAR